MPKKNPLQVTELSPEHDSMHASLGISDERAHELSEISTKAHLSFDTMTKAMEVISAACKHANELAWIMFIYGSNIEERRNQSKPNINQLSEVLKVLTTLEALKKGKKGKKKPGEDKEDKS